MFRNGMHTACLCPVASFLVIWAKDTAMAWILCPPPIHILNSSPSVMVLGGGPLGGGEVMMVEPSWWGRCPLTSSLHSVWAQGKAP